MKFISLLLLFITNVGYAILPNDVSQLVGKRKQAIERIDKQYIDELKKLQIRYTKIGDLETALAIKDLISEVQNKGATENEGIVGKWIFVYKGKERSFQFSDDYSFVGHYQLSGKQFKGTWKQVESKVILFHDGKEGNYAEVILSDNTTAAYNFNDPKYNMKGRKVE